jgi:CRP-like cAMP-binding protein
MNSTLDICNGLPECQLPAGEDILIENGDSGRLYILKAGAVEILKKDLQINVVSTPGAVFGEVSLLLKRPHMATVRTLQPTSFYVVDDGIEFLQAHPDINLHIARLLAGRLNSVTNYLVDLQQQFNARDDHLGMVDEVLESLLHHHADGDD